MIQEGSMYQKKKEGKNGGFQWKVCRCQIIITYILYIQRILQWCGGGPNYSIVVPEIGFHPNWNFIQDDDDKEVMAQKR